MRVVVAMRTVADLVEEIEVNVDATDIERDFLTFVLNEWDAQALEEALLIKDSTGAEVVAVGLASDPDIDQFLFTALAKGVDRAVRLVDADPGETWSEAISTSSRAGLFAAYLEAEPADLVLTGVQAPDDVDGQLAPRLGALLDWAHVSVVVGVEVDGDAVLARQEFAAGRVHELALPLPAVFGIQTSRETPRYAAISRIKQAMQTGEISDVTVAHPPGRANATIRRVFKPEPTTRAQMLSGDVSDVAEQIVELLRARGLLGVGAHG